MEHKTSYGTQYKMFLQILLVSVKKLLLVLTGLLELSAFRCQRSLIRLKLVKKEAFVLLTGSNRHHPNSTSFCM